MPDTVPGSTSSTVTITVGTSLNGEIETPYDEDWYRVSLTANVTYTIRVMGRGTGSNTLEDPLIDGIYTSGPTYRGGFNNDGLISGPYGRDAMTTFTPTTTGYHWINVMGDLGTVGTFTISVVNSTGGTDNVPASTATSATVAVGGSVTGTIDNATDVDWYRVSLTAGTSYTIRLRGATSGGGTLADPVIAGVYNSSGVYIPNTYVDDFGTRDPMLTFVAPYTGTYYIAADGWNNYTGTFTLEVAVAVPDVAGNTGTTATLAIGASTTVYMDQPYDHDWYAVTLTAGRTYEFSLAGTGSNNTPGIHGIFNSAGNYAGGYAAAILGPGTAAATTIFTPSASGTYYIDTYSIYQGTYTLSSRQVADDVPADTSTTATVAIGGSVIGDIGGATDVDWYGVSLVAGTTYVIKMQGAQSGSGTLADPIIAGIYNASGVLVPGTFADDTDGNEASLVFRPTASGTYYIAADGYAGYTGTYRLSVATLSGDVGHNMATAATVALNTPTVVTIDDPADTDWFAVTLTGGSTYGIRLMGASTQRGTLYDPVLVGIYDSNGVLVTDTYVDDARGLLDSILQFTPAASGTYYIVADGYDRFTGTMKLAVTIDNIGTTNATAGSFAVGAPAEGTIDYAGDIDRYAVNLDASSTYYIRMLGFQSRNGDLADPHISGIYFGTGSTNVGTAITDAAGADPVIGTDAWFRVVTAAGGAGTYYVVTTGNAGTDGAFLLTADKDIPGSQATTATVAVGGSVTSYIDEGTDADWFAVSLTAGVAYVIKMQGSQYGNGTLIDPYINGVRYSTTPTTIISGTSGTTVDNNDGRDSVVRLVPGTTGTYYIAAQSSGTIVGSYRITVDTEVGQTTGTSAPLAIGGSVTGTIDDTNDTDWYSITVVANTAYLFKMTGVDSGGGTLDDPVIARISNGSGTAQSGVTITSVGMDSYARWIPTASGTFYINATGGGTDTGTFTLTAETEVGSTTASADTLAIGASVTGTIDVSGDTDWYQVALATNTSYIFRMQGLDSNNGTLPDPNLVIRNSSGTSFTTGVVFSSSGNDAIIRYAPTTAGNYYIDAQGAGTAGTFLLTAIAEPGSTNGTSHAITVGSSVMGELEDTTDVDRYSVSLNAGTRYRIRMEGADSGNGTLADPWINGVRNSGGTIVVSATEGGGTGRDAYVIYTPSATGTYYIDADTSPAAVGTYKLTVELWP